MWCLSIKFCTFGAIQKSRFFSATLPIDPMTPPISTCDKSSGFRCKCVETKQILDSDFSAQRSYRPSKSSHQRCFFPWRIHGTGIFTYIWVIKNQPNVGKYTIHGWYGVGGLTTLIWVSRKNPGMIANKTVFSQRTRGWTWKEGEQPVQLMYSRKKRSLK